MGYIGDSRRMTLHRVENLRTACYEAGLDVRDIVAVHSGELRDYLLRSEHWHECHHCAGGPPGPESARDAPSKE